jgi:DNA-binding CsgD family transcriptional regulator/PAS domain-containing protein
MSKSTVQSARVTLRQLCNLGLPAPVMLPSLLPALRSLIPATHAAFFYCDSAGHMVNMYAERMLPPEAMSSYYEKHYRAEVGAFSQAYLARVAAADAVSLRTVTAAERETEYYREVFGVLGVGHVMYGIVRSAGNGREPIGQLSMYRSVDDAAFNATDADTLREVLHYLGPALAASPYVPVKPSDEQTAEEAMAVLDEQGDVLFADDAWVRLTRMARGEAISPGHARDEPKALREFLRGVVIAARAAKKSLHVVHSAWGQFAFRHHQLAGVAGTSGGSGGKATAMVLSRLAVASVRLTEGAARLDLSSQQREVALMIALGLTNSEMADKLGVSVNTAGYHVKQVFAKLGVHERADVARLLRQA